MINRSIHTIFETSGQPIPSEEEVAFEAREMVQRSGWGLPLLERLRKVADPYWREAITRCLMDQWNELVRDKDEQTYYYDMDGDVRFSWADADYDFGCIIRRSTNEQADAEQAHPAPQPVSVPVAVPVAVPALTLPKGAKIIIMQNHGPIISDSDNVNIYKQ